MSVTACPECKYVRGHRQTCSRNVQPSASQADFYAKMKELHDLVAKMKEELGPDSVTYRNGKVRLSKKGQQWMAQQLKGMK